MLHGGSGGNRDLRTASEVRVDVTCDRVIEEAAAIFGVCEQDLYGHGRTAPVVAARQAAMYVCRVVADESLATIGSRFGGRDDTTVLHAVRQVDQLMTGRTAMHAKVVELTSRLGGRSGPGRRRPGRVGGRPAG